MGRKTLTVSANSKDRFDGHKREDESQTELLERALDALEAQDAGVNTDRTQIPDDILTEDHLSDISTVVESAVEKGIDNASRR